MKEIKEMLFDGTSEEFRHIVESYQLLLYSVVYAASAYAEADDIVQETFIYAYYHWGMLREKEKLSAWLCAIARNKAAHSMKKKGKTVSLDRIGEKMYVSSPESAFLRQERRAEILKKISGLSEKYRETVMLYYFAEKSISEISAILEIPEGTVKFRLYEARKKLQKELLYMIHEEKENITKKNIWGNIKTELQRAIEARCSYQNGKANAICDILIEQFQTIDPTVLSKEEIRLMIGVYTQKFYANLYLEPREKNMIYIEKCVELAEISGDEGFMQDRYALYACELSNLKRYKEAFAYYEKSLILAEKLNSITQIAVIHYRLGTLYLDSEIPDIDKAKVHFEKAVAYKDMLSETDYGKYIYTLVYSAFVAINRVKTPCQLCGFSSAEPSIVKTKNGFTLTDRPGYAMGKYRNLCTPDIIASMNGMHPFLSNDICDGYTFEQDTFSHSKIPVHSRYEVISMNVTTETPAGIFENCLHIRYTDQTEDESNFKVNGVRNFFYAPNVGLVMMHFKAIADWEYTVKLTEYHVTPIENGDLCDRYFPLNIGNVWYYDSYGADGNRFDKVDYENRFEVVAKRVNDTVTSIAHSGWICKK